MTKPVRYWSQDGYLMEAHPGKAGALVAYVESSGTTETFWCYSRTPHESFDTGVQDYKDAMRVAEVTLLLEGYI